MTQVYFDYAAATPMDLSVTAAMLQYTKSQFYNPSAQYDAARTVRAALEDARNRVARVLGCRASEIIYTAGGTESDNLAVHGIMRRFPNANLVVSAIEHDAVLAPAVRYKHRLATSTSDGIVTPEAVKTCIDDDTILVSVMLANNEIGSLQPISKIAAMIADVCDDRRQRGVTMPLYLHSDACQAANYLDLHVSRLGVDMLTLNGGKIYGPKQSGILFVKGGVEIQPLIDGGGQERGLRSGTENVAASIGFAQALELAQEQRKDESVRLMGLQCEFKNGLQQRLPTVELNGSVRHRLPNNIHLTIPGYDNERLLIQLDQAGIQASAGSACSASSQLPSHVLRAIGKTDEQAQASLRFTMGRTTTSQQVEHVIDTLAALVA